MEAARRINEIVPPARSVGKGAEQLLEAQRSLGPPIARRAAAAARVREPTARPWRSHLHHFHDRSTRKDGLEYFARRAIALIVAGGRDNEDEGNGRFVFLDVLRCLDDGVEHMAFGVGL